MKTSRIAVHMDVVSRALVVMAMLTAFPACAPNEDSVIEGTTSALRAASDGDGGQQHNAVARATSAADALQAKRERKLWRENMRRTFTSDTSESACFRATYPDTAWEEIPCVPAPDKPHFPHTVGGGGPDFSALSTTNLSGFAGEFPDLSSVVGLIDSKTDVVDDYSIQGNTNYFDTAKCNGSTNSAICKGWQQFIFWNPGPGQAKIYMQYWLLNYVTMMDPCSKLNPSPIPPGTPPSETWQQAAGTNHCWRNSVSADTASLASSLLEDFQMAGSADSNWSDLHYVGFGGNLYGVSQPSLLFLGAGTIGWNATEFNIFGASNSSEAEFNANATMTVRTTVARVGGNTAVPACLNLSYTGETNNLSLLSSSCCPVYTGLGSPPYIEFTQSNDATVGPPPFCLLNAMTPVLL